MNRGSERRAPELLAATETRRACSAAADASIRADLLDPCPSCGEPGPHDPGVPPAAVHCRRGICGARWGERAAVFSGLTDR